MIDNEMSRIASNLRNRREQKYSTELFQSEYLRITLWCYNFCVATIESSPYDKLGIMRRNRIFQYICKIAEQREELPTIQEYARGRVIGVFPGTVTTLNALEYISMIQDRITSLNDWRIQPEPIED